MALTVLLASLSASPSPLNSSTVSAFSSRGNHTNRLGARIVVNKITTLSPPDDRGIRICNTFASVARSPSGDFYVSPECGTAELQSYSPNGTYKGRVDIAVPGSEPRGSLRLWFDNSNRLHVFDTQRHHFVYELGTRRPSMNRTPMLPRDVVFLPNSDDRTLQAFHLPTPDRAGWPLHLVEPDGIIVRSFGAQRPEYRADRPQLIHRAIALARDGEVYVAQQQPRTIQKWTLDGRLVDEFEELPDLGGVLDEAQSIALQGLREDSSRILWTLTLGYLTSRRAISYDMQPEALARSIDSVIEAYSFKDRRRLASLVVDEPFARWWLEGNTLYSFTGVLGNLNVAIWHVEFIAPT